MSSRDGLRRALDATGHRQDQQAGVEQVGVQQREGVDLAASLGREAHRERGSNDCASTSTLVHRSRIPSKSFATAEAHSVQGRRAKSPSVVPWPGRRTPTTDTPAPRTTHPSVAWRRAIRRSREPRGPRGPRGRNGTAQPGTIASVTDRSARRSARRVHEQLGDDVRRRARSRRPGSRVPRRRTTEEAPRSEHVSTLSGRHRPGPVRRSRARPCRSARASTIRTSASTHETPPPR